MPFGLGSLWQMCTLNHVSHSFLLLQHARRSLITILPVMTHDVPNLVGYTAEVPDEKLCARADVPVASWT